MLTDPKKGLTAEAVSKELKELEANFRERRNTLRALLRALQAEQPAAESKPAGKEGSDASKT